MFVCVQGMHERGFAKLQLDIGALARADKSPESLASLQMGDSSADLNSSTL